MAESEEELKSLLMKVREERQNFKEINPVIKGKHLRISNVPEIEESFGRKDCEGL